MVKKNKDELLKDLEKRMKRTENNQFNEIEEMDQWKSLGNRNVEFNQYKSKEELRTDLSKCDCEAKITSREHKNACKCGVDLNQQTNLNAPTSPDCIEHIKDMQKLSERSNRSRKKYYNKRKELGLES